MAKAEAPLPKAGKISKRRELAAQQRTIKMFVAIGVGALLLIAILVLIGSYAFKGKPKPIVPVPIVDSKPGSGPSLTQPILDILMEDPILALNISLKRHFAVTVSVLAVTALLVVFVISIIIYVSVAPAHIEPEPQPEPEIIIKNDMSFLELLSEDPLAALMRPAVLIPVVATIAVLFGVVAWAKRDPQSSKKIHKINEMTPTTLADIDQLYKLIYSKRRNLAADLWSNVYHCSSPADLSFKYTDVDRTDGRLKWYHDRTVRTYMVDYIHGHEGTRRVLVPCVPIMSNIDVPISQTHPIRFHAYDIDNLGKVKSTAIVSIKNFLQMLWDGLKDSEDGDDDEGDD